MGLQLKIITMMLCTLITFASATNWQWKIANALLHPKLLNKGNTNGCWVQKSGVDVCQTPDCGTRFNWRTWKHHCYVCGIVVCSKCTSNGSRSSSWYYSSSWFSRNKNRRCRNAGAHQNRETECLQRRITLGSCEEAQWLREMMKAITHQAGPPRELTRDPNNGTHSWNRAYQPLGGWNQAGAGGVRYH